MYMVEKTLRVLHYFLFLFVLFLVAPTQLSAQRIGDFWVYASEGMIVLDGEIKTGSQLDFQRALRTVGIPKIVLLNSGGGNVSAALEIASEIYDRNLTTYVQEGKLCASACSIIFFAGKRRLALGDVGVHQMSSRGPASLAGLQFILADVLSAFDSFGVDYRVLQKMLRTPPANMYFFSQAEKEEWSIDRFAIDQIQPSTITFSNFPPPTFYDGALSYPDFDGRDRWARMYRTRIRNGIANGVNFGGKYALVEIGCGTSCRFAFLADVSTGMVYSFPYGGEEHYQLGLVYAADSRLIRANWRIGEMKKKGEGIFEIACISQDLVWSGTDFKVVNETTYKTTDWNCSPVY
jgi:hypothetical protein